MFENFNDKISENIIFMAEEENSAWTYYHYYYFVTESGKLYKCEANGEQLADKSKDQINRIVKSLDALFIKEANIKELNIMLDKSKKIALDSNGYFTGSAFDAGNTMLYAFNSSISKNPIMVGQRGNSSIHSRNQDEEEIALWLEKLFTKTK